MQALSAKGGLVQASGPGEVTGHAVCSVQETPSRALGKPRCLFAKHNENTDHQRLVLCTQPPSERETRPAPSAPQLRSKFHKPLLCGAGWEKPRLQTGIELLPVCSAPVCMRRGVEAGGTAGEEETGADVRVWPMAGRQQIGSGMPKAKPAAATEAGAQHRAESWFPCSR